MIDIRANEDFEFLDPSNPWPNAIDHDYIKIRTYRTFLTREVMMDLYVRGHVLS
jgi:hypothetical protein